MENIKIVDSQLISVETNSEDKKRLQDYCHACSTNKEFPYARKRYYNPTEY